MTYVLSKHAEREMLRRNISPELVKSVMDNPDQVVEEHGQKKAFQSIIDFGFDGKYLVRVIVNDSVEPFMIVTVYKTSKVKKYWREP